MTYTHWMELLVACLFLLAWIIPWGGDPRRYCASTECCNRITLKPTRRYRIIASIILLMACAVWNALSITMNDQTAHDKEVRDKSYASGYCDVILKNNLTTDSYYSSCKTR